MNLTLGTVLPALTIGIGATMLMDLWNLALRRLFGIPSLNYRLLGRWLSYMPMGTFRHSNIAASQSRPQECSIGWAAHYSIGIVFGLSFVAIVSGGWLTQPTLLPALAFGLATVVFPFFILQPGLGLGIAGAKTPRPAQARLKSLATHTTFGLGLYASGVAVNYLLTAAG